MYFIEAHIEIKLLERKYPPPTDGQLATQQERGHARRSGAPQCPRELSMARSETGCPAFLARVCTFPLSCALS